MWYEGLSERFGLNWDEDTILKLANRTNEWKITKKLTETSPDELKEATLKTYTDFKKEFLKQFWSKKIKKDFTLADYINRLEYELKVIHEMWYDTYFLIVQDYIMYGKTHWIVVWPWRWSAAWSLLWYLIRITEIDPMEYDLLFERFLNPARVSMPDIDTDFEDSERDKILDYCKNKYWVEKVANIWTYMTMAAKASFKDVARVFWLSFTKANQLSSYIEWSIQKSYQENEEFKKIVDEDEVLQQIVKYASNLEWNVRQLGVHACGVIIAPEKITEYTPVQYPLKSASKEPDKTRVVTQYDGHYLEDIGLLKMDFLWLRNLSIIKNTLKILKAKWLIWGQMRRSDEVGWESNIKNDAETEKIIWIAMKVHDTLWPMLQEKVYKNWLYELLLENGYKVEKEVKISYKINWKEVWYGKIDLLVNGRIAIELKSTKIIKEDYYKQLRTYINQSDDVQVGLILNFYHSKLWIRRLEKGYFEKTHQVSSGFHLPQFYSDFFKYYVFEPPIDDEASYKIFQDGDTVWVFQFESDWMRAWLKKLKPTCIDDIIAMVALYRPWPMEWIPNYIARKEWTEKISYLPDDVYNVLVEKYWKEVADQQRKQITEDLSPFMDVTYWIPIYQEQLMRIVQAMAWFSLGEADLLRRWVWKKIKEVIEKLKIEFIEKSAKYKSYKEEVSRFVYEKMIEPAANYSFNKSHAACYAIIAYQTAYLKAHHPIEFYAALLRSVEENTDRFAELLEELKIKWIKIKPVNVNYSYNHIAAVDDSVVIWFLAIKWIWFEVWEHIEQERKKNWPYKDLEDFILRNKEYINKKTLEALAKSWALDDFASRKEILENIENILSWLKGREQTKQSAGMGLFGEELLAPEPLKLKKIDKKENLMEKLQLEYEAFWTFISSHPFDGLYSYIKRKFNFTSQILDEKYEWDFKLLGFVKDIVKSTKFWGYFVEIEDLTGTVRFFLKNIPWIEKFSIVVVEWRKQKRPSISKIQKIDLEKFLEKLKQKWKYKPEETVAAIRKLRWEKVKVVESSEDNDESSANCSLNCENSYEENDLIPEKNNNIENNDTELDNINDKVEYYEIEIELPEDIDKLYKLAELKKKYPNKKEIELDGVIYLI